MLKRSNFIVFSKVSNDNNTDSNCSCIVYNTKEQAKEAIEKFKDIHKNDKYVIKLVEGEVIDAIYSEI